MQRFSVSVDDDLAAWIESEADERGVSKAKIIRDSVETAQVTGLIRNEDTDPVEAEPLIERIEILESRVETLENSPNHQIDGATSAATGEDIIATFRNQLRNQPPTTEHGKEAVVRVFEELLKDGPLQSKELRERLYPEFETEFANPNSMWQSTQRHFSDIVGIENAEHGTWEANPEAVEASASPGNQGAIEEFNQETRQSSEK